MPTAVAERNNGRAVPVERSIKLPAPEITTFNVRLEGTTPLITDAFSEARRAKLAQSQDGSPKQKPGPRRPDDEFEESVYRRDDGAYGIPKLAFRKAIQTGAMRMTEIKGTEVLAAFQIDTPDEYLALVADAPKMRTDHVVRMGRGNLAYRAEFWPWAVTLPIKLDHEVVTLDQFIHIVYKAGMGVGVGNWRAEKKGDFGLWTIKAVTDVYVYESPVK
jgi:hypothetical protein